jgi:hypothetical protein
MVPYIQDNARISCDECNRHFRNVTCFDNHKQLKYQAKLFVKLGDGVASGLQWKEGITSAINVIVRCVRKRGIWDINVIYLVFQTMTLVLIKCCMCFKNS